MKTFDTNHLGGMPLVLDDLAFMESIHKDVFNALMSVYTFNGQNLVCVLSGCERTVANGIVTITDGWMLYEGEVCRFIGSTFPLPTGTDDEFIVAETINLTIDNSQKYFQSPLEPNPITTYKEKIVKVNVQATGITAFSVASKFFDLQARILATRFSWKTKEIEKVVLNNQSFSNGVYDGNFIVYGHKLVKQAPGISWGTNSEPLGISGEFAFEDIDNNTLMFNISDTDYRKVGYYVCAIDGGACLIRIKSNGDVVFVKFIGASMSMGLIQIEISFLGAGFMW